VPADAEPGQEHGAGVGRRVLDVATHARADHVFSRQQRQDRDQGHAAQGGEAEAARHPARRLPTPARNPAAAASTRLLCSVAPLVGGADRFGPRGRFLAGAGTVRPWHGRVPAAPGCRAPLPSRRHATQRGTT
jgi:hypothetical protein